MPTPDLSIGILQLKKFYHSEQSDLATTLVATNCLHHPATAGLNAEHNFSLFNIKFNTTERQIETERQQENLQKFPKI